MKKRAATGCQNLRKTRVAGTTVHAEQIVPVGIYTAGIQERCFAIFANVLCPLQVDRFRAITEQLCIAVFVLQSRYAFPTVITTVSVVTVVIACFIDLTALHTGPPAPRVDINMGWLGRAGFPIFITMG